MKYLDDKFSTPANSKKYRDNFDKVFKKAKKQLEDKRAERPTCKQDIFAPRDDGRIYCCKACGKTSKTKAPTEHSDYGWDESCMLNCMLVEEK